MNIAILAFPNEKKGDVTQSEAKKIMQTAQQMGHNATVYYSQYFAFTFDEKSTRLFYKGEEFPRPDVIISRVHLVKNIAERMAVLRDVELMKIPVVNTFLPNLRARNKFHSFQLLAAQHLPLIKTAIVANADNIDFAIDHIGSFPIVVKAISGNEGKGVSIFESRRSLLSGLEMILSSDLYMESLILQEFVETGNTDYRIIVVDGKVVGQMERHAPSGDFRANLSIGGSGNAVDIPQKMKDIAIKAAAALELDVSGVDILMTHEGPKICEINSCPGLKIEDITGAKVCEAIVKLAVKKAKEEN